jgi:hypothetical protein
MDLFYSVDTVQMLDEDESQFSCDLHGYKS